MADAFSRELDAARRGCFFDLGLFPGRQFLVRGHLPVASPMGDPGSHQVANAMVTGTGIRLTRFSTEEINPGFEFLAVV